MIKDELIETYISEGPKMIDYLHENSQVKYRNLAHYPDYFPDNPGGKAGNRSMEPEPIYGTKLGKISFHNFSDGEFQPSYEESIRGTRIFIIASTKGTPRCVEILFANGKLLLPDTIFIFYNLLN